MANFWKDYKHLCGENLSFFKKHWKGCFLISGALTAAEMALFQKKKNELKRSEDVIYIDEELKN